MKKIKLFVISKSPMGSSDKDFRENIVAYVTKKKDIIEYIRKRVIMDHYAHYEQWCELQKLNSEDEGPIDKYFDLFADMWGDLVNYTYKKYTYSIEEIASIMRILNKCVPVGGTYETDAEIEYMNNYFKYYQQVVELMEGQLVADPPVEEKKEK